MVAFQDFSGPRANDETHFSQMVEGVNLHRAGGAWWPAKKTCCGNFLPDLRGMCAGSDHFSSASSA
jgi:hypothetical protein